jgi:predicted nucleic acid-binding protein
LAFTVVYDASVLHPASVRDLLVRLAQTGLFRARWSNQILDEMVNSVLRRQPDLDPARLARTRDLMCRAVADCMVEDFDPLIEGLDLPDPDDRHVLAAAIKCHAQVIVTENLRDFPDTVLDPYGIEAQRADEFVLHVIELAPAAVAAVLQRQADALVNPPQSLDELLDRLRSNGLDRAVAALGDHL